jgi:hypothetical protein
MKPTLTPEEIALRNDHENRHMLERKTAETELKVLKSDSDYQCHFIIDWSDSLAIPYTNPPAKEFMHSLKCMVPIGGLLDTTLDETFYFLGGPGMVKNSNLTCSLLWEYFRHIKATRPVGQQRQTTADC